jgi:maltooligosyltrehalose trehalohydrolase
LHHLVDLHAVLAATALLLLADETPLLFMGQEWACSSPFMYFTDHDEPLGTAVVEGRRREFAGFTRFSSAESAQIPSPQDARTYRTSVLRWDELAEAPHRAVLEYTRQLVRIRQERLRHDRLARILALDEDSLVLIHAGQDGSPSTCTCVRLSGGGNVTVNLSEAALSRKEADTAQPPSQSPVWVAMWSSRSLLSSDDSTLIRVTDQRLSVTFAGPGAVMFGSHLQESCG